MSNSGIVTRLVGFVHGWLVFDRRTQVLADHIADLLPKNANVLDVGCGDGTIDALIQQKRPDVSIRGVDVQLRPAIRNPVDHLRWEKMPFDDGSFDTCLFVDVLHHTADLLILLKEAARVARTSVILKDHTMNGLLAYTRLRFMDWVGNAPHGVVLPYNYWPERRRRDAFGALGLTVVDWQHQLALYPPPLSLLLESRLHFIASLTKA